MDWDDLKVFLGTAILIIGLAGSFVYINEKNDRKNMKEISSSKVVGKYSYIVKTSEQIMPVTTVSADGTSFQTPQYIPESTVQLLRENHEKLFSYKINLESFNLKARRTEHLYQLMPKICAIAGCFVR